MIPSQLYELSPSCCVITKVVYLFKLGACVTLTIPL